MKRLRTWAWPDPTATGRRLRRSGWGEFYWRAVNRRKSIVAYNKRVREELARVNMTIVPLAFVSAEYAEHEAALPTPAVH